MVVGEADLSRVFAFNHDIFADEIGQHAASASGQLIDAFHTQNEYLIAEKNESLLGMICLTQPKNGRFSVDSKLDPTLISQEIRSKAIEVRLLAVKSDSRGSTIGLRLMARAASLAVTRGYSFALISAIENQRSLYIKFGFKTLAPAIKVKENLFTPMVLSLVDFNHAIADRRAISRYLVAVAKLWNPYFIRVPESFSLFVLA